MSRVGVEHQLFFSLQHTFFLILSSFSCCLAPAIVPVDEQEADTLLELYRDIVEKGPDLFSMHDMTLDAPFR